MKFINQIKYKKLFGVYKITCLVTNIFYIGSTINTFKWRLGVHIDSLVEKDHHSKKLQSAYNKYGSENFTFEILEVVENSENCISREQHYLDTLLFAQEYIRKEDNRFQELGFNISPTAQSVLGLRWTEESKRNQSKRAKKYHIENPEKAENHSKYIRERFSKIEEIEKQRIILVNTYNEHPEMREAARQLTLKRNKEHPEIIEKQVQGRKKFYEENPDALERASQRTLSQPLHECKCGRKIRGIGNFNKHQKACEIYQLSFL